MSCRQRAELDDLRRQLEENSSLAGRALREELDKSREEQERRHQVRSNTSLSLLKYIRDKVQLSNTVSSVGGDEGLTRTPGH